MNFYPPQAIKRIKSLESPSRVYKSVFNQKEIQELIQIEEESNELRMVDRADSRKTKIEQQSRVKDIITGKIERVMGYQVLIGDFPAHFVKNRYPLRIHADMGKDPSLLPYKNILIPLYIKGKDTTYTLLFKQRWYGQSSLFSSKGDSNSDHYFKDMNGVFVHVKDSQELLDMMRLNMGKEIKYSEGSFMCSTETIEEIEALLQQERYSDRTNKHIVNNVPFNVLDYERFLTHQPYEDLAGLEIESVISWVPGDVIVFDRSTIHCASNFLSEGVEEKMAVAMFTVWNGDGV